MPEFTPIYATKEEVEAERRRQDRARRTKIVTDGASARRADQGKMIVLAFIVSGLLTMIFGRYF